jgi:hypothetical protein
MALFNPLSGLALFNASVTIERVSEFWLVMFAAEIALEKCLR